jgi:hypothetical protein
MNVQGRMSPDEARERFGPKVSRSNPCPKCEATNGCRAHVDRSAGYCFRGSGAWRDVAPSSAADAVRAREEKHAPAALSDEALDRVYRSMLAFAVELFDVVAFAEQMRARGFKRIPAFYAPLGADREQRALMVKALRAGFGSTVARVPFARHVGDVKRLPAGILVPVRNVAGLIVGVQLRAHEVVNKRRYLWGRGATARVHVAYPDEAPRAELGEVVPPFEDRTDPTTRPVYVTEGALKATVASQYLRTCVIGLPGVATNHDECIRTLRDLNAREVVLAFDSDWLENDKVASAGLALCERIQAESIKVSFCEWGPQ